MTPLKLFLVTWTILGLIYAKLFWDRHLIMKERKLIFEERDRIMEKMKGLKL